MLTNSILLGLFGIASSGFSFFRSIVAGTTMHERDIRVGETDAAKRAVSISVFLTADGTPKTGLTAAKAKISWNDGAPVDTTANFSYVAEEVYSVTLTQAEVDARTVGDKALVYIPAGSGYQSAKTTVTVIQNGAFAEPLTEPLQVTELGRNPGTITETDH